MTTIGSGSDPATIRYEHESQKLKQMERESGPDSRKEAWLPRNTDGWLTRTLKVTVPYALGGAMVSTAALGVGVLSGRSTIARAGGAGLAASMLAVVGPITLAGLAAPLGLGGDPLSKDSPDVAEQRQLVRQLWRETPLVKERLAKIAAE